MHWCSGAFPQYQCYNSRNQWCCTDGSVCDDEGCCKDLFVSLLATPLNRCAVGMHCVC